MTKTRIALSFATSIGVAAFLAVTSTHAFADSQTATNDPHQLVRPVDRPKDHIIVAPTGPQGGAMGSAQRGPFGGTVYTDGRGNSSVNLNVTGTFKKGR